MVSPGLAREMIVPTLIEEMVDLRRSIFHLDGPQALRHLDLVLELPGLNAVQWTYGHGHGPAARWIDLYRKILSAGKGIEVIAVDAADALAVLESVGPRGVWLMVLKPFGSPAEIEAFLKDMQRLSARCGPGAW
jgi:hypothetical protein